MHKPNPTPSPPPSPQLPVTDFVSRDGTDLILNGSVIQFVGFNAFGAACDPAVAFQRGQMLAYRVVGDSERLHEIIDRQAVAILHQAMQQLLLGLTEHFKHVRILGLVRVNCLPAPENGRGDPPEGSSETSFESRSFESRSFESRSFESRSA